MSTAAPSTSSAGQGGRRRPPNLADDDLSELGAVLGLLRPQSFGAGQLIFDEDDPGDRVYVIRSGVVKVTRHVWGGRPNLVAMAGPGDIIGELAVFDPGPRTSSALTVGAVEAGWLDRGSLRRWMFRQPAAGLDLLQLLARQVKRRHHQFAEQRVDDVEVRVARQLLDLTARFGVAVSDGSISLPHLTDEELADLVGAATPQVAHVVADLIDGGVIHVTGSAVTVGDHGALSRVATRLA